MVEPEDVNLAIAEMLRLDRQATGIDRCRLIEFDETGGTWPRARRRRLVDRGDLDDRARPAPEAWLCTAAVSRTDAW